MKWFVLTFISLWLFSCNSKPDLFDLVVLADRSDPNRIAAPTLDQIRSVLPETINKQTGIHFRLRNIGENEFLPAYSLSLKPTSTFENTIRRKVAVDHFLTKIDSLIQWENNKMFSQEGSSILTVLTEALEVLSKSSAQVKTALLYSDGYEFSHLLNTYDPKTASKLLSNPEEVAQEFLPITSELSLQGVDLYIIYYPHDKTDALRFRAIVTFYKRLFEGAGLAIHVGLPNATTPL